MRKSSHPQAEVFPLWLLSFLFLTTTIVYLTTLNPSLFRNDSPETITACVTLGVSHPPSYPLHTLLGHLFSYIRIGNPAMTLNFFSALLGSTGVCLFALNLWVLLSVATPKNQAKTAPLPVTIICLLGSLCFAFSKSYWSASLAAKGGIYVLQMVLDLSFFFFLQKFVFPGPKNSQVITQERWYFLVFLFALGFVNHWPTQFLLIPSVTALSLFIAPDANFKHPRSKTILTGLVLALLVFSLNLYLPLRAHSRPNLNFNSPDTFQRFVGSLFRIEYGKAETFFSPLWSKDTSPRESGDLISKSLPLLVEKANYISGHLMDEFHWSFPILALLGAFTLLGFKKEDKKVFFLLLTLLVTLLANLFYLKEPPIVFWAFDDPLLTANWIIGLLGHSVFSTLSLLSTTEFEKILF